MAQRVSQNVELVLGTGTPNQRVSQELALVLGSGSAKSRITQLANLVLADLTTSPYYVQGAGGGTTSLGGSHSVTMPQTITVGGRLVVMTCLLNTSRTVGSVTDNAVGGSSTYSFVGAINMGSECRLELWTCDNAKAATTITVTLSTGTSAQCSTVTEWKNSVAFGQHGFATATGATDPSLSLTIQDNGNTVVGGFVSRSAAGFSPGAATLQIAYTQADTGNGAAEDAQSFVFGLNQGDVLTADVSSTSLDFAIGIIELRASQPAPTASVPGLGGGSVDFPSRIQSRAYSEFIA